MASTTRLVLLSTKILFDEDYYERGLEKGISGYSNYRWMPELTIPMCSMLNEVLGIKQYHRVLDFGCAKGFMVRAMRLLHRKAWGCDSSKYAVAEADTEVRPYISTQMPRGIFDWIIAKDVLEHISYKTINGVINRLSSKGRYLFCVVPLGKDGHYIVPSYNLDITHQICESLGWWTVLLQSHGFLVNQATYRFPYVKTNYIGWKKGNGFILAQSTCQTGRGRPQ